MFRQHDKRCHPGNCERARELYNVPIIIGSEINGCYMKKLALLVTLMVVFLLVRLLPIGGLWHWLAAAPLGGIFANTGQVLSDSGLDVAMGDLDGDGDLDVFIARNGPDMIWFNDGNGSYSQGGQTFGTSYSVAVALGDLDGDGDLDVVTIKDEATSLVIWINQGGVQGGTMGTFLSNGQTNIGDDLPGDLALGDVDGDDDLDIFLARIIGRPAQIWLNNGSGQFTNSGQSLVNNSSSGVVVGDLDEDGDLDALTADDSVLRYWVNQGGLQGGTEGVFADSGQVLPTALSISLALGDIDRDGDLDVVTASVNQGIRLWLNQGGVLTAGALLGPNNNRHVTLVDVDVDGDLDLFVARNGANTIWLNQGGTQQGTVGQFLDSGQQMGNNFSPAAALSDIDGDNDPDAIVANFSDATEVWRNDGLSGLETLYRVRDEVMAPTPQGQHYIDLFYLFNAEILSLILADPTLFAEGYDTVTLWLPNLASLVNGGNQFGDPVITVNQVQAVDGFLTNLAAAGSPTLQQTISDERDALPDPSTFIGLTMSEARTIVLGNQAVYLPLMMGNTGENMGESGYAAAGQPALVPTSSACVASCLLIGNCNP